jgi:hypothetical protein
MAGYSLTTSGRNTEGTEEMTELEWTRCVMCPQDDRFIEVDNECIGCEHYEGEDDFKHTITCNFKKGKP